MYCRFGKRALDLLLSGLGLVLLSPLLAVVSILIKADSKGPVIFRQQRYGAGKKLFSIRKFRTMKTETPSDMPTNDLADPDRYITRIGKFLRKTSLDELPQLWNIFIGEMALVGPRPALWNQYDLMELRDANGSSALRPGLTGWAQVNGRDELAEDVARKAALDGEYVQKVSFIFDLKCLFLTAAAVVSKKGFSEGKAS